jgi:hypothetical protein
VELPVRALSSGRAQGDSFVAFVAAVEGGEEQAAAASPSAGSASFAFDSPAQPSRDPFSVSLLMHDSALSAVPNVFDDMAAFGSPADGGGATSTPGPQQRAAAGGLDPFAVATPIPSAVAAEEPAVVDVMQIELQPVPPAPEARLLDAAKTALRQLKLQLWLLPHSRLDGTSGLSAATVAQVAEALAQQQQQQPPPSTHLLAAALEYLRVVTFNKKLRAVQQQQQQQQPVGGGGGGGPGAVRVRGRE